MSWHPADPPRRHVWVRSHGNYGPPTPGVVSCWQHAPVHNAAAAEWVALVAQNPFDTALLVDWVSADRLVPTRDDTPLDSGPA